MSVLPIPHGNNIAHAEVAIYPYTLHVPSSALEAKTGGFVIRRAAKSQTMLTHLMKTCEILKVTSLVLSEILNNERVKMPKNSSKAAKIRKLMTLESVRASVTEEELACIEKALCEQEKQRSQKKKEGEAKDEDADDEEAI